MKALDAETIHRQFAFLAELDRLKSVIRQSPLINRIPTVRTAYPG